MQHNEVLPIHLIAQELSEKTVELAHYKVAYQQLNEEVEELKGLKELIDSNKELKELVEEIKSKEDK
ncbi:Uncharacterised protein [Gemella morbillorum]|uniref:hypothetical protein n=1 Tax=Gemella morbillorum TaxID=29391 RepID=UPI000DA423EC|nr:hypothetical protein [Gemella morbillorum]UBH81448.1 hypothetical protein LA320_03885 [Gemella morbillorum]SQH55218.1 Uncharacterised protein [Gemella morbillorum]